MINKNELGEILKTEVNSASLTYQNHDPDNGFLYSDIDDMVAVLNDGYSNIEPIGICRNVPFPCSVSEHSVAFVYKIDGDIRWCHFTELLWFSLLSDVYDRKEAGDIIYGDMEIDINEALADTKDTLKELVDKLEAYNNQVVSSKKGLSL